MRRVTKIALALLLVALGSGMLLRASTPQPVGTWSSQGGVLDSRTGAASVALPNGVSVILGGAVNGTATDSVVLYDPADNSFSPIGQMLSARTGHTATLLRDGRIVVTGGSVGSIVSVDVEIVDPGLGTSTLAATLTQARTGHSAALLQDGTVLIVGGTAADGSVLASAEIFNPDTSTVTPASFQMATPRTGASATALIDGRVLVAGGNDGSKDLATAELYDPAIGGFMATDTQLAIARQGHTAVLLPNNGGVLIAGGTSNGAAQVAADLFVPSEAAEPFAFGIGKFQATGDMTAAHAGGVGGPSVDGYAVVTGGGSNQLDTYRFATIKTDKDDYAPGTYAKITGSGWQAGETVRLIFQEDPEVHADREIDVVADDSGSFVNSDFAPEQHDLGVRFYLTAVGSQSTAQTTFMDGPLNLTFTGATGGSGTNGGTCVVSASGTTCTVNGPIAVTSLPATITVNYTCTGYPASHTGTLQAYLQAAGGILSTTVSNSTYKTDATGNCTTASMTLTVGTGTPNSASNNPYSLYVTTTDSSPQKTSGVSNGVGVAVQTATSMSVASASGTYGGTTNLSATLTSGGNPVNGKTVSFTLNGNAAGTATTNTSGVASLSNVSLAGIAQGSYASGVGASFAGDTSYQASSGTAGLTVNKATVTAAITASNKGYDGTTTATVTNCSLTGVLSGDTVTCSATSANFDTKNVGTGKTVTAAITLGGASAGNYQLASSSVTTTANITAKAITVTAATNTKNYDGTTSAAATPTITVGSLASGDTAAFTETYDNANAGTGKTLTPAGTVNDGNGGNNYTVTFANNTTGVINKLAITVTAVTDNKVYDGTTSSSGVPTLTSGSLAANETGTYTQVYGSRNVTNTGTTIPSAVIMHGATDVTGNYAITLASFSGPSNKPKITARPITVTAQSDTKVYDGTTASSKTPTVTSGSLVGGDTGNFTQAFDSANAGSRTLTATGSVSDGNSGNNYNVSFVQASGSITKAAATVTLSDLTKTYNGSPQSPTATTSPASLNVTWTGAPDTNAGSYPVTATINDTNYQGSASGTFVINKANQAALTLTAPSSSPYNSTFTVTVSGGSGTGTVTFSATGPCTVTSGGVVTMTSGTGTCVITATNGGDSNYNPTSAQASITATKADATVSVNGYTGTYDGQAHGATGTATGVNSEDLSSLLSLGTTFTNVPGGTANWSFAGNSNYNSQSGSVAITINKANATINVTGYTGTYDAQAHGATGTATGIGGADLSSLLNLGASFTNAPGGTANWSFAGNGNYNGDSGSVQIVINKANATVHVDGYTGIYDGQAHGATGTATGVGGADLSSLLTLGASYTNVPGGTANWSFAGDTNYNPASGSVQVVINKANATVHVNGYTGTYDAQAHGATGTATGVNSENLSSLLSLGASYTNAPGGAANWSFAGDGNYNGDSGTVQIVINKANATVSVTGYTGTYDGQAHGASGTATGVGGADLSSLLTLGASYTNAPGGTANWSFAGDTNYNTDSGSVQIVINKANATVHVEGYTGAYDAQAHGATGTATGIGGADLSSLLTLGASFTNAPGGTANWSFAGDTNYNADNGSVQIVINKVNATVAVSGYTGTYDGQAHGATGTATGVGGANLSSLLTLGASYTNAPGGTANWSFAGDANYNSDGGNVQIVINKATVTAHVNGYTGTYDGQAHGASGNVTGVNNEPFSVDLGATFTNAPGGSAHWSFAGNENYDPASGDVTITINKANQTITWATPAAITYGTPLSATQLNASTSGDGALTYTPAAGTVLDAGTHTLSVTAAETTNYNSATQTVSLLVNPRPLTVTVSASDKVYDGTNSATVTFSDDRINEDALTVTGTGTFDNKNVGTGKTVTVSNLGLSGGAAGNYSLTSTSATTTANITARALTITAGTFTKVYDGNTSATGATTTNSGLQSGDTVTGVTETYDTAAVGTGKTLSVTAYTVNDGNGGNNYTVTTATNTTGVITARPVTVTASSQTVWFGEAPAPFTWSVTSGSLLGTDSLGTGSFTFNGSPTIPTAPGVYTVAVTGLANANYAITAATGSFTIKKRLTAIVYTGPTTAQSFDCILLSGVLTDVTHGTPGTPIGGAGINLTLDSTLTPAAATTDGTGKGAAKQACGVDVGNHTASASYAGDTTHEPATSAGVVVNVTPRPVSPAPNSALYTGSLYFWTANSTSSTATLTLSATIVDTSTDCAGDISKARVTFTMNGSPIPSATNLPVGPISAGNTTTGVVAAIVQYDIGNANASEFTLGVVVTGGRYARNLPSDSVTINVVRPGVANSITFGGALNNAGSNGFLIGATGTGDPNTSTSTIGGFVQYNKSGTNPQGNVLLYIHSYNKPDGSRDSRVHTYLVKTNAIAQLVGLGPGVGGFSAKASIQDVTDPTAVSVDGGSTVQINVINSDSSFSGYPSIAVQVTNKQGGLWFSGNWNGVKTVQTPVLASPNNAGPGVARVQ